MSGRLRLAIAAVVLTVMAFGAGYWFRDTAGYHPPIVQADCQTAADGDGTCFFEGTAYGVESSVPWMDASGAWHTDDHPPACLPPMSETKDLSVVADWVWIEGNGFARVLWVDCRTGSTG